MNICWTCGKFKCKDREQTKNISHCKDWNREEAKEMKDQDLCRLCVFDGAYCSRKKPGLFISCDHFKPNRNNIHDPSYQYLMSKIYELQNNFFKDYGISPSTVIINKDLNFLFNGICRIYDMNVVFSPKISEIDVI